MKLGYATTKTYWYAEDEIKKILGECFLDLLAGEIVEPYTDGRKIKYKFDGRRKKPYGLKEPLKKD